jgi:putative Mg2+ transporter-C (MgtC) family protein
MIFSEEIIKLLMALLVGGLIGAEREFRHRAAGFRTIIFICLGSTIFTMLSLELGGDTSPVRIAAHVVTGVGFLCAGVVMEDKSKVVGLTTASTIWFTAALGMGIGGGQYVIVIMAIIGAMVILWVFPILEEWIYNARERRTYEMVCEINFDKSKELERLFQGCGLRVEGNKLIKRDDEMICVIEAYGAPKKHELVMEKLLTESEVKAFKY